MPTRRNRARRSFGKSHTSRRIEPGQRQHASGFDFTCHMRALCEDIVQRSHAMRHIDASRVAISFSHSRKPGRYGIWAALTPLRFAGGAATVTRGGTRYRCQRVLNPTGREMLYILNFYLPRFMDLSLTEKVTTIFHELWHISPEFDGDIRRFSGRCYAHSHSEKTYDAAMRVMADQWLALKPPPEKYAFLRYSFDELNRQHGPVMGVRVAHPKLIREA